MAKVCMAGEPGRDPAFAVHFFIFLEESLYPLQLLLLQQGASERGKIPEVQSLNWVFFFQVQLVIRNLLVLLPEVLWDCARREATAQVTGVALQREVLNCPGGKGVYQLVSV